MKRFIVLAALLLASLLSTSLTFAEVNAVTPSTNDINRTNGWAHVNQTAIGLGTTTLEYVQPRDFYACFEYRTDGDTSQMIDPNNYNGDITDGLYPYYCLTTISTRTEPISAIDYVEVRTVFGGETDERFDWTRFDVEQEPVPFACTGDAYTVRAAPADLFRIDQTVSPFVFQQIGGNLTGPFGTGGSDITLQVNNLGYDTIENLLYAVAMPVSGNFNYGIIKIDSTGKVFPVDSDLPSNVRFLAGDVSTDGTTFYINTYPSSTLYKVDLGTLVVTEIVLDSRVNVADWAYNPTDEMLYGAVGYGATASTGAPIFQMNPDSGVITLMGPTFDLPLAPGGDAQYYGGAWFNQFGHLFLYRNSDWIYEVDLGLMKAVANFEGGAGPSGLNDATACAAENPGIDKFYTHTNNDWSMRCIAYKTITDPITFEEVETEVCAEYRQPNIYDDDDIFALPLDMEDGKYVLIGKALKKKTVVTPGQYIAVSEIKVITEQDVWVLENFENCTMFPIGEVAPYSVPGGVQVVRIDANGDVYDIDDELALGIGGSIELNPDDVWVHVEAVPAGSTLRVMVKFQPNNALGVIGEECTNFEVLYDGFPDDGGEEIRSAEADLIVIDIEDLY